MILDGRALAIRLYGEAGERMTPADYLRSFGFAAPEAPALDDALPPLEAEVNHGIWIVRCDCGPVAPNAGGVVWCETPTIWCPRCERHRRVALPAEAAEIEGVLMQRPEQETRNWSPPETVADLVAENTAHGLSTLEDA